MSEELEELDEGFARAYINDDRVVVGGAYTHTNITELEKGGGTEVIVSISDWLDVAWGYRVVEANGLIREATDEEASPLRDIPSIVTSAQFKCALGEVKYNQIESVLASIPDEAQKFEYTQYWNNTTEFSINHPMVQSMQIILGWTNEEKNQLFIDAGDK